MKKRYKIVLNIEIDDPDDYFVGGGDYANLTRKESIIKSFAQRMNFLYPYRYTVTLDKVIDKGEIAPIERNN